MKDDTAPAERPNPITEPIGAGQQALDGGRAAIDGGRAALDGAYSRADKVLDRTQFHVFRLFYFFIPSATVIRRRRFQSVVASRFLSDAGQQALAYGAIVALVRGGGTPFEAALIGVAVVVPPTLFGLYGGTVADALPKRVALAAIYNVQAALCFIVPFTLGDGLGAAIFLLFAVHSLGQISGPTESSVVPYVASEDELASAASVVSFASNLGTAFGTALLAPIMVRVFGTDAVFYTGGVLLALAATRVYDLRTRETPKRFNWRRPPQVKIRATIAWLLEQPAVGTMIIVAVLAGTANIVLQTLAPQYVSDVLDVDPADAVYVFGPSALGLGVALISSPMLIRNFGERSVALCGFVVLSMALVALGMIEVVTPIISTINPLNLIELFGVDIGDELATAGFLAMFVGFGLSLVVTSVQTYLNRRVPLGYQGRAFALQTTLKNGASIVPLLLLGAIASAVGVQGVLIISPLILLAVAASLVRLSAAMGGQSPPRSLDVIASFWDREDDDSRDEVDVPEPVSDGEAARPEDEGDPEHRGTEHGSDEDALRRAGVHEDPAL